MNRPTHLHRYRPLFMFDWDGVVVVPSKESFSIMREAFRTIFDRMPTDYSTRYRKIDWPIIFEQTSGTTEAWFIDTVCREMDIAQKEIPVIKASFIDERARLVDDYNHKRKIEFFDEGRVFADFRRLASRISSTFPEAIFAIVSGNPTQVLRVRVPKELRESFDLWIGGEYGRYRHEMVQSAQNEAIKLGWQPYCDGMGKIVNAFYFDDSIRAVTDVLHHGQAKVVWVVRPSEGGGTPDNQDPITQLMRYWPGERKELTYLLAGRNNRGMPALYVSSDIESEYSKQSRDDCFLLITEGGSWSHGFLDPESHSVFGVKPMGERLGKPGKERF